MNEEPKEKYQCCVCGWMPAENEPDGNWDHCPNCFASIHETGEDGCDCGGTLRPISVWVKPDDSWEIIQRCSLCGELTSAPISGDDNPIKLLSLAIKPLSIPPFPIEKMQEMTTMMGGQGDCWGYYDEQRK